MVTNLQREIVMTIHPGDIFVYKLSTCLGDALQNRPAKGIRGTKQHSQHNSHLMSRLFQLIAPQNTIQNIFIAQDNEVQESIVSEWNEVQHLKY